jgi:thiamine-monophosphate kinase
LALPENLSLQDFDDLIGAFVDLGKESGAPLVGGNLARTPGPLVVDSTAIGCVRPRRVMRRSGGKAGDELYVTGTLGAAAAGLAMLDASVNRETLPPDERACIDWYERPHARLRCGLVIGRGRAAAACMDLSDGLADAAGQVAAASGTGVVLMAEALPVHAGVASWCSRSGGDALGLALSGGEDYELLFAVRPRQRRAFLSAARQFRGVPATLVGRLTADPGAWLERDGRLEPLPAGFTHF